ncbi:MAG: hypothetical protein AB7E72_03910 [Lysobacterales bacterium]
MHNPLRERWPEVKALFEAASMQPRAERSAWLATQPADAALRAAVVAMLADADSDTVGAEARDLEPESAEGQYIGRYRILRTLGRGGMGVVYLAEQANPQRLNAGPVVTPGDRAHRRSRCGCRRTSLPGDGVRRRH